jgi:hypothetical protein
MRFPDGGMPRVITIGGRGTYPRLVSVPYADDPGTGLRWVAMDRRFQEGFVGAMGQNAVQVEWVWDTWPMRLRQLADLLGMELTAGAGPILAAAVERLQGIS